MQVLNMWMSSNEEAVNPSSPVFNIRFERTFSRSSLNNKGHIVLLFLWK